jgi:hypothetical protein
MQLNSSNSILHNTNFPLFDIYNNISPKPLIVPPNHTRYSLLVPRSSNVTNVTFD